MFQIKNVIFQSLTPRQKSALFSYLKSFVKKHSNLTKEEIKNKFIEDETYYFEINNPHFEFLIEAFENDEFLRDIDKYTEYLLFEIKEKEKLAPLNEKQKQMEKEKRKRIRDYKLSKLKPTKKQLYYYEKISKAHNVKMHDTKDATRLDLRNWIMELIEDKNEDE